jgi:hypothetical protein
MALTLIGEAMSQKPGRNDPCPCGSGKKFKKCCESKSSGRIKFTATKLDSSKVSFGNLGIKEEEKGSKSGGYSLAERVKNLSSGAFSSPKEESSLSKKENGSSTEKKEEKDEKSVQKEAHKHKKEENKE